MKRILFVLTVTGLMASCGGSDKKEGGEKKGEQVTEKKDDVSSNPDYQNGLALIAKSDCLTCHKVDEKLIGPSYRDVANKYAGTSDTIVTHLAGKIISGGSGVWGEVLMTPHAAITKEDAETMVKYIMLLKK